MCLAILKPENQKVDEFHMQTAFDNNDDGAGFAYVEKGKVVIEKGFMTFKPFWEALVPHMDKPMLIHFRWATHGLVDKDNCHPFKVAPDLAMIHNGIISGIEGVDALTSDTNAFVKHYVGPMNRGNPRIIYSEYGKLVLEKLIGSGSKLVFLNKKGKAVIINESA